MHKKGCEITSQQTADFATLWSGLSSCGIRLPSWRETSGGNPQHYTKRLRNHFATKGWFRSVVQNSSFSLEWSACNGCNSFISTPNYAPFEALDCWLPELWNGIQYTSIRLHKVLQKWLTRLSSRICFMADSLSSSPCIPDLLLAKDFKALVLHVLSFQLLCPRFHITLLNLGLLWWSKAIKTPKLNTIWLKLIARILNMLIG